MPKVRAWPRKPPNKTKGDNREQGPALRGAFVISALRFGEGNHKQKGRVGNDPALRASSICMATGCYSVLPFRRASQPPRLSAIGPISAPVASVAKAIAQDRGSSGDVARTMPNSNGPNKAPTEPTAE